MMLQNIKNQSNLECRDYLAANIRAERKRLKLNQKEFALLADIPFRTYKRFEQNCNGSIENFINVLRAFDKLRMLEAIFPSGSKTRVNFVDRFKEIQKKSDQLKTIKKIPR